jgi:hypothetical protein
VEKRIKKLLHQRNDMQLTWMVIMMMRRMNQHRKEEQNKGRLDGRRKIRTISRGRPRPKV